MRRGGLALLLITAAVGQAPPAGVRLEAEARPAQCHVGDPVVYQVVAVVANNVTARLEASPPAFTGFEVEGEPVLRRTERADDTVFEWSYRLRARAEGALEIRPFSVSYSELRGGRTQVAQSQAVRVTVTAGQPDRDIRPAKGLIEVPAQAGPYRLAAWLLGVLGGMALLTWLLAATAGRRAKRPPPGPAVAPAAHKLALYRLDELAAERLPERGAVDEYHVRLSIILREYLAVRYRIDARESTTREIAVALFELGIDSEIISRVREVLYGCDLEKFAGHVPSREEMEALMERARELVLRTAPSDGTGSA